MCSFQVSRRLELSGDWLMPPSCAESNDMHTVTVRYRPEARHDGESPRVRLATWRWPAACSASSTQCYKLQARNISPRYSDTRQKDAGRPRRRDHATAVCAGRIPATAMQTLFTTLGLVLRGVVQAGCLSLHPATTVAWSLWLAVAAHA